MKSTAILICLYLLLSASVAQGDLWWGRLSGFGAAGGQGGVRGELMSLTGGIGASAPGVPGVGIGVSLMEGLFPSVRDPDGNARHVMGVLPVHAYVMLSFPELVPELLGEPVGERLVLFGVVSKSTFHTLYVHGYWLFGGGLDFALRPAEWFKVPVTVGIEGGLMRTGTDTGHFDSNYFGLSLRLAGWYRH